MKNQQINIINNFNLFINEHEAQATSQNTPPRGQRLRDVFAQYRQVPSSFQPQAQTEFEVHYLQHEPPRQMHVQITPIEGEFDLEVFHFVDLFLESDRSREDLLRLAINLRKLAYIKKYGRSK